jgi:hypothetical protein
MTGVNGPSRKAGVQFQTQRMRNRRQHQIPAGKHGGDGMAKLHSIFRFFQLPSKEPAAALSAAFNGIIDSNLVANKLVRQSASRGSLLFLFPGKWSKAQRNRNTANNHEWSTDFRYAPAEIYYILVVEHILDLQRSGARIEPGGIGKMRE